MPWPELGAACLLAALGLAGFSALVSFHAGLRQDALLARVGRRAFQAVGALVGGAAICLVAALLGHDFRLAYVTEHTDRALATPLLIAAFYSGQEGSLLYWTLVLCLLGGVALLTAQGLGTRLEAYAGGFLALIAGFLLVVLVFAASPFDLLTITPADGLGLNPILRDGGMLIHPPFLLAGYSSFAIPFAFALASLLAGRQDAAWVAHTRRFALLAWALQSVGLVLGMWWAYHVLGWGGYWGWDPVENMALVPWLAATAYIHSAQVQERRGRLRLWTQVLVVLAFLLAILGTFITRSGLLQSVHTFAVSAVGPWFYGLLVVSALGSAGLLVWRSGSLRSEGTLPAAVSREGAFLLQNLLIVGVLASVLWGTLLPVLSGFWGQQRVVGASYYERVAGPLCLGLLALLALGPLVPWRQAGSAWRRGLAWPLSGFGLALAALLLAGARQPVVLLSIPLAAAAAATALRELALGVHFARRLAGPLPMAALRLAARNRRRYSAHLVHLGVAVVACGIAGSHLWQVDRTLTLQAGESVQVAGYQLQYLGSDEQRVGDHTQLTARLQSGEETLEPARLAYPALGGQSLSLVSIRSSPRDDLYVVFLGQTAEGAASFHVLVNPMVTWIWSGAALLVVGVLWGHLPAWRQAARLRAAAPMAVAGR